MAGERVIACAVFGPMIIGVAVGGIVVLAVMVIGFFG